MQVKLGNIRTGATRGQEAQQALQAEAARQEQAAARLRENRRKWIIASGVGAAALGGIGMMKSKRASERQVFLWSAAALAALCVGLKISEDTK